MLFHSSTCARRYGLLLLVLASLSSCAEFSGLFAPAEKPVAKPLKKYDAAAFVEDVSVARIKLENGGELSAIADEKKTIEGYSKQKKTKPASVTLAVFEYDDSRGKAHRTIAPIGEKSNLSAVSNVLASLDATSYKLKDVHVRRASVSPLPMKITADAAAAKETIDARHQAIIASAYKIPPLQEAKLQLKLLRFFIGAQQRDAAYICADNAKRLLSAASQGGADAAAVDSLTKELETAEGELRQSMPY